MMRWLVHGISLVAGAYTLATVVFYLVPAWKWLPLDLAYPVGHSQCVSARVYLNAMGEPDVAKRILPIVMAHGFDRGVESESSLESCRLLAAAVRESAPALHLVPTRHLCASIRRWARETYQAAGYWIGPPLWIVDGQVIGAKGYPGLLDDLGLSIDRTSRPPKIVILGGEPS